ncbi:MAG TPA: cytochrome C oxidase subunit IV family protein [Nitriliruptoraceae bacterium]|nr:cytochrome C oxidase subunit IV family protein [Nitriliruptoraceae bacterium]
MSATTSTGLSETDELDAAAHEPSVAFYIQVAVVLAVLTAMEFSTYFIDFGPFTVPLLLVLMAIKFALIVGFFMHLKFDTDLYSKLLLTGLVGALVLYVVVFLALGEVPLLDV